MKLEALFLILMCAAVACTSGAPSPPPDAQQLQRMAEYREKLKDTLGERYEQPVPPATEAQLKRGEELYPKICASCHGGRGQGNGRVVAEGLLGNPTDFTDPEMARFYSEQARLYIIKKGVPGTPMMGWESVLSDEDIHAVYAYIRSLIRYND